MPHRLYKKTWYYRYMHESQAHRRMAENEVIFRHRNERVQEGFDEIRRIAQEDNQEFEPHTDDSPLQFFCECADENCTQRIELKPSMYNKIHEKRDQFIIVCGHQVTAIEQLVTETPSYSVVKKYINPPENSDRLNTTPINNI